MNLRVGYLNIIVLESTLSVVYLAIGLLQALHESKCVYKIIWFAQTHHKYVTHNVKGVWQLANY